MKTLSELKISPTPWKVDKDTNGWYIVRDAKGKYAATPDGDKETEAISNARLFVAAPNMYQKAYELIEAFDRREMKPEHINALRAALAKAAGEEVAK